MRRDGDETRVLKRREEERGEEKSYSEFYWKRNTTYTTIGNGFGRFGKKGRKKLVSSQSGRERATR